MTEDLNVLEPQVGEVDYRGERLEIRPLTIGQLPKFVRLARPIIELLLERNVDQLAAGEEIPVLLEVVGLHGEDAIAAAALLTGKPIEWIGQGNPIEFAALVRKVFEVNRDFFTPKLGPLLAARAARSSDGNGPTASSSSSSEGTA